MHVDRIGIQHTVVRVGTADDYFNASRVYTSFQKLKPGCARILVKTTYELEGDRLEILLTYDRIEGLRALGRASDAAARYKGNSALSRGTKPKLRSGRTAESASTLAGVAQMLRQNLGQRYVPHGKAHTCQQDCNSPGNHL